MIRAAVLAMIGPAVIMLAVGSLAAAAPAEAGVIPLKAMGMPGSVRQALLDAESDATVAVSVLDTRTGDYYGSTEAETQFPSESVVKVLIAANLLATGQMTGTVAQQAYQMITTSDDDDADALWGLAGGAGVVDWAQARYGIDDLGAAPSQPGWWGNTKITARGMVELYAAIKADPVVGPWLIEAMSHMAATADDGTDQDFGLAAQTTAGAFKQGWGGDDDAFDSEQLNSTGLLQGDRYAVAVLVQHVPYEPMSQLLPVLDSVSAAVAPGGAVVPPQPAPGSTPPAGTAPTSTAPTSTALPTTGSPAAPAASTPTPSTPTPSTPTQAAGVGSATVIAGPRSAMSPVLARTAHALIAAGIAIFGLAIIAAIALRRRRY